MTIINIAMISITIINFMIFVIIIVVVNYFIKHILWDWKIQYLHPRKSAQKCSFEQFMLLGPFFLVVPPMARFPLCPFYNHNSERIFSGNVHKSKRNMQQKSRANWRSRLATEVWVLNFRTDKAGVVVEADGLVPDRIDPANSALANRRWLHEGGDEFWWLLSLIYVNMAFLCPFSF